LEKINECKKLLAGVARSLQGEELSRLDFDRVSRGLLDTIDLLEKAGREISDLAVLKQDYIGRISGMEKAIAIAGRRDGNLKNALMIIENLETFSAGELIGQYAKTQARFRDAFPTSFGLLPSSPTNVRRQNIAQYK